MQQSKQPLPAWGLDNIPYENIDHALVRDREDLFYFVTGASFIEIASDLYTSNLVEYFQGDEEAVGWLRDTWQHEELRHGYSLRGYVRAVWPQFDWQAAFDGFYGEYSRLCTVDEFEPTRGLEMAARCVVETGTATIYTALADLSPEPVLTGIAARIRHDEINHYKYFYKFFRLYKEREGTTRWSILKALKRRVFEARESDVDIALWHAYCRRVAQPDRDSFKAMCAQMGKQIKRHYPVNMAAKMILRPLALPTMVNHFVEGPLARAAGWLLR
jgi:hypothetical protein